MLYDPFYENITNTIISRNALTKSIIFPGLAIYFLEMSPVYDIIGGKLSITALEPQLSVMGP